MDSVCWSSPHHSWMTSSAGQGPAPLGLQRRPESRPSCAVSFIGERDPAENAYRIIVDASFPSRLRRACHMRGWPAPTGPRKGLGSRADRAKERPRDRAPRFDRETKEERINPSKDHGHAHSLPNACGERRQGASHGAGQRRDAEGRVAESSDPAQPSDLAF